MRYKHIICAVLFFGTALLFSNTATAGSCCGGGSATSLILPKYGSALFDISVDTEKYNGLWDNSEKYLNQSQYHLWQYRLNLGYAQRIGPRWQANIVIPYVWNYNGYPSSTSRSEGIGDTTLSLWYEAGEDKSAWRIQKFGDLAPSLMIGASLLLPTGISPYDNVNSSFDVTGRGFYRLDGNILIDKTIHPWSASLSLSYGTYIERPVNREYGRYVEPYHKKLGDRTSAAASISYISYIGTAGDALTGTISFSYLHEDDESINGVRHEGSGFKKESVGAAIAYSSTDHDWSIRLSWSHAVRQDGWGESFPTTDIYTVGVRYVFR